MYKYVYTHLLLHISFSDVTTIVEFMWSSEIFVGRYKVISSMQNAIYALEFYIKNLSRTFQKSKNICLELLHVH